jgi:large subunit ribosomal protein L24
MASHKMRIRTDDEVIVIGGKDKGKTGKVLRVDREKQRVFVEGLNIIKRHQRPSALNPNAQAGVIEREGPIHVSNVALLDPKDKKPTRIGTTVTSDGKRARVAKRSGTQID